MDKAKYVTIRQYIGKEDYYVTSANMMSPEGSDYSYAEDVRVSNRLVKAVRAKALDELQVEVDPEDIETSSGTLQRLYPVYWMPGLMHSIQEVRAQWM